MRRLPVLIAGVALLTTSACGDDDADVVASTSTMSTTTTSEAPPVTPAPGCSAEAPAPVGTFADGPVAADVDSDGLADEVSLYVVDDRTIEVAVVLSSGGSFTTSYDDGSIGTDSGVRTERVADVDGDGAEDLWLVVGSGAAAEVVTLARGAGCRLVRPDVLGTPNQFAIGASVGALNGIECVDNDDDLAFDGFLEHAAEATGESTYRGTSTFWSVSEFGDELIRGESESFTIDLATGDHNRYARLSCD